MKCKCGTMFTPTLRQRHRLRLEKPSCPTCTAAPPGPAEKPAKKGGKK